MFKAGQYAYFTASNGARYVYRIVSVGQDGNYIVQIPYFAVWGSVFGRWSTERSITAKYLERKCTLLPADIAVRYDNIKRGNLTSVLFD